MITLSQSDGHLKRILSSSLLFLMSLSPAFSQAESDIKHLNVKRLNDSYIDVYYNSPVGDGKYPLLILCQGSGSDSNTTGFLGLGGVFADQVVGLVIEKQGVQFGDSPGEPSEEYKANNAIYNRVYDYLRVLQYLKKNAPWWNGDVYVVGGSEGGLMAGLIASFYPKVKGVAILSFGGGLTFGEAWPIAREKQVIINGGSTKQIEEVRSMAQDTIRMIRGNASTRQSYSGDDNTFAWWASIVDLRLQNVLVDIDVPIFLGQGSEDQMAPVESARRLKITFDTLGKTNLIYKEYLGYDHGFSDQQGKSHLVEVFLEAIQAILPQD